MKALFTLIVVLVAGLPGLALAEVNCSGAVVGLVRMGPNSLPDSHIFRPVNGKIRYVHTLTVCIVEGCGFGPPPGGR